MYFMQIRGAGCEKRGDAGPSGVATPETETMSNKSDIEPFNTLILFSHRLNTLWRWKNKFIAENRKRRRRRHFRGFHVVSHFYFCRNGICILKRLICFYFGCLFPLATEIIQRPDQHPGASQRILPRIPEKQPQITFSHKCGYQTCPQIFQNSSHSCRFPKW